MIRGFERELEGLKKKQAACKGCSGGSGSFCGDCRIKSYYTTLHSKPSNYITGFPNFVNNDI